MKKIFLFSMVLMLAAVMAAPAMAQGQNGQGQLKKEEKNKVVTTSQAQNLAKYVRRSVNVQGELVSVSGTTFPATLVVKVEKLSPKKNKKWTGAYPEVGKEMTVKVYSDSKFVRKWWGKSSLEELTAGDKLELTVKTNEDGTVTASRVKNDSLQWSWKVHNGIVENLDLSNKTFTLKQSNGTLVSVKVDDKTKVVVLSGANKPETGTVNNLQNGNHVHVRGVVNNKTKVVTASYVKINPLVENISATTTVSTTVTQ